MDVNRGVRDTRPYFPWTPPGETRVHYRYGWTQINAQSQTEHCTYDAGTAIVRLSATAIFTRVLLGQ
jgi:hypothetical protein